MVAPKLQDADFIRVIESGGIPAVRAITGQSDPHILRRRRNLEAKLGREIVLPGVGPRGAVGVTRRKKPPIPPWRTLNIPDGVILIAGDCHFWPGHVSTTYKAFVRFCERDRPKAVIMNGDVLDGASISRHSPMQWEKRPSLVEEIEECAGRLKEIAKASGEAAKIWTLGNHDARFESRLATVAPEFAKVRGMHLKDHFPDWEPAMSVSVNDDAIIKHRWHSGVHATFQNVMKSGRSMITNHLHQLKVTPFTDYNGRRYGVDTGTLADPYGPQFEYTEWNPVNWWSGFAKLTFRGGELLPPELVEYWAPNAVAYRGEIIEVA